MKDTVKKIFTRRGDRGETRLLSGETAPKDDLRVQTYGALDELQAHLGMARALIREDSVLAAILTSNRIFLQPVPNWLPLPVDCPA